MRYLSGFLLAAALLLPPSAVSAQDFGVMESAETINPRNFKLRANPMILFGRDGGDGDTGAAILAGYGVSRRFDVEGGVAFYDGVTFFGASAEFWLVRDRGVDISFTAGLHHRAGDATRNLTGVDLTFLGSGRVGPRVELYGGVDLAFEGLGQDGGFRTAHLVPGLEVRINESLDFVAEAGMAMTDASRHYVAAGLAFYVR